MLVEGLLPIAGERLVVIGGHAPITDAARMLSRATQVKLLVVCSASGVAVGVLTKTDIVRHISHCQGSACTLAVATVMTQDIVSCRPRDWLQDVWSVMRDRGLLHIPILDHEARPIGVVYARDALQALLVEAEYEEHILREYVMCVEYH
jgi:CBS domain-containing protein